MERIEDFQQHIHEIQVYLSDIEKLEKKEALKLQKDILRILRNFVQISITFHDIFLEDLLPLKEIHLLFKRSTAVHFSRKEYLSPGYIDQFMQTYVKGILRKSGQPVPDRINLKHLRKLVFGLRGEKKLIKLEI